MDSPGGSSFLSFRILMKKTIFLILTVLLLLVWGFFALDAYLCTHLYYWWGPFTTCSGGQGAWINMLWTGKNWSLVVVAIVSSLLPLWYMILAKNKMRLRTLFAMVAVGAALYMTRASSIADSLLGAEAFLIQVFHVVFVFALFLFFVAAVTALGDLLFKRLRRQQEKTIHGVFFRFAIGLVAFCVINILLLMRQVYFGITVRLEILALVFLLWKQKTFLQEAYSTAEQFLQNIYTKFTSSSLIATLFFIIVVLVLVYLFMWFNLAFIPYSTAWDANHAYLFFPRAWSLNNGLYWGSAGASTMPYLWYGFLTFWFKFASSFFGASSVLGISPDGLTVSMNFWSWLLVLIAFVFLLDAFVKFLQERYWEKKAEDTSQNNLYTMIILCVGVLLMMLWLTSWMGAFLVFVDNKTDLAVMFFSVLALYAWIQFVRQINGYVDFIGDRSSLEEKELSEDAPFSKKKILHFAILSGILFAASAVAKPTGMFDFIHFGILFLLQRQVLLFWFGAYTLILWALWLTQMMLIGQFLTVSQSWVLVWVGVALLILSLILAAKKKWWNIYFRYLLIWAATIIAGIALYKGPFVIINNAIIGDASIPSVIRTIFLGKQTHQEKPILLASNISPETLAAVDAQTTTQLVGETTSTVELISWEVVHETGDTISLQQCLATPTDKETLYTWLKELIGSAADEDLGRYIGYGWKSLSNNLFTFWIPKWCYSLSKDAQYLCKNNDTLSQASFSWLLLLLKDAPQTELVQGWLESGSKITGDLLQQETLLAEVKTYVQSNSIQKAVVNNTVQVNIPYKYLIPFNVTFNWSLQNLSSYYTDIGIIWLLGLWLVILWLLYGLIARKRQLAVISVVTLGAWATWRLVGSWIIWYSLGLILWTILGMIAYFYYMYRSLNKSAALFDKILLYVLAGVFLFFALIQLFLNLVRIWSQWAGGPFVWYKGNVGEKTFIDKELTTKQEKVLGYSAKDVFDLQFPHYNPILAKVNTRADNEWVVIAGTYMQYFVDKQRNVSSDWFLTEFWKNASDNNVCNTYKRIVDKGTKYLVIDPNIASVVMWWWNSTLLDRFFAVVDKNGNLLQHGTLSMLQALVQNGYLELMSTNSLVTKYAFIASDEELSSLLKVSAWDELLLERARMSAARFFPKTQEYAEAAASILSTRIQTLQWVQDIADVLGKQIDEQKLVALAKEIVTNTNKTQGAMNTTINKIGELTEDERTVLQYFISIYQARSAQPATYRQYISSLISASFWGSSQVMAFTVK